MAFGASRKKAAVSTSAWITPRKCFKTSLQTLRFLIKYGVWLIFIIIDKIPINSPILK
jgi:hypothetical protein